MAKRLATEYVKTCLRLSEAEMSTLIQLFTEHQIATQVKVLENGSQDIALSDPLQDEVLLHFDRNDEGFECSATCTLLDSKMIKCMRIAVARYKGNALVNRVYPNFIIEYQYVLGQVVKITELTDHAEHIVFERREPWVELQQLFENCQIEQNIADLQSQVDDLLDQRLLVSDPDGIGKIDRLLFPLSKQLFHLEA